MKSVAPVVALALAIVLAASAIARPAPTPTCAPKGSPIVELDQVDSLDTKTHTPTSTVKLYTNGTVIAAHHTADDKAPAPAPFCLDAAAMKTIKAALKAATWKLTHRRIHCMAKSRYERAVTIDGRHVFTERICNSDALDDVSAAKLAEIEKLLPNMPPDCDANPLADGCVN